MRGQCQRSCLAPHPPLRPLDADIRSFFDTIDHEWLIRFLQHRIGDERVIRHVRKWLKAGVLIDGRVEQAEKGTPQGGIISPLLANIYLHYVFDLWAHQWRKRHAKGSVMVVRYADDFVVGFQRCEADAQEALCYQSRALAPYALAGRRGWSMAGPVALGILRLLRDPRQPAGVSGSSSDPR